MRAFFWVLCVTGIIAASVTGRVWFVRHCDKPPQDSNPCCSAKGIRRMTQWGQFMKAYLSDNATVQILTAADSTTEVCSVDRAPRNPVCQLSARFHESSRYIQNALQIPTHLEERLCIGQSELLAHRINATRDQYSDTIVVWEHRDMARVLWHMGQSLAHWPTNLRYDLVFVLEAQQLVYRSVPLEGEQLSQPLRVGHWRRATMQWTPDERRIELLSVPPQNRERSGMTHPPEEEKVKIIVTIFLATMAVISISICVATLVLLAVSKCTLRQTKNKRLKTYGALAAQELV